MSFSRSSYNLMGGLRNSCARPADAAAAIQPSALHRTAAVISSIIVDRVPFGARLPTLLHCIPSPSQHANVLFLFSFAKVAIVAL